MASASAPSALESARSLFSPHSTAKSNEKAHSSGRMVSSGISDVVIASIHSEKTRQKKLIIIIIIITEKPFTSK